MMEKNIREGKRMAARKVGDLIKEARLNAGLTQEQLAKKVDGVTAADISKAERGEKELTQAALRQIAKATGVTQKSLLEAPAGASAARKTATAAKKPAAAAAKKPAATAAKKSAAIQLTAAEKRVLELYRAADSDTKKAAEALLKGKKAENGTIVDALLGGAMDILSNLGKK